MLKEKLEYQASTSAEFNRTQKLNTSPIIPSAKNGHICVSTSFVEEKFKNTETAKEKSEKMRGKNLRFTLALHESMNAFTAGCKLN